VVHVYDQVLLQVELVRGVGCWPLLQLVSIGCHAACSTLHSRLLSICEPAAPAKQPHTPTQKRMHSFGALSMRTPVRQDSLIKAQPAQTPRAKSCAGTMSPSKLTHPEGQATEQMRDPSSGPPTLRTYGIMSLFISAGKHAAHAEHSQCTSKAQTQTHEYPILFMAGLANTMERISEVGPDACEGHVSLGTDV
jgi:hypothetical protein